ncbi:hypothetical protein ACRN9V_08640 [Shewanella baltica]|uniref:hypothetical protein n=1 Tax=Shewanella baltica TaxID=62322 RepID=UPI003D79D5A1
MPFSYKTESKEFGKALLDMAVRAHREQIYQYVSKDNMHSFQHGRSWLTVREDGTEESSFKETCVELSIGYEDIIKNDINQFFQFLNKFIEGFTSQTMQGMFQTISESCDKIGNTVNQKEYASQAEVFLEMLKKVEFCVIENGQVVLPQIHVGTDAAESLMQSLEAQDEEFHAEVERIKQEKSEAALTKEKERLNRYKGINI